MGFLSKIKDKVVGGWTGFSSGGDALGLTIRQAVEALDEAETALAEARDQKLEAKVKESGFLAEIELALEDIPWRNLNAPWGGSQLNRESLRRMMGLSRIMYLMNPLIKRAVTVQELYVWGSGCTLTAKHPKIQEVLDDFFDDPKNQSVLGAAWPEREREQRIDGNTFFVFFLNKVNGTSRVRLIPTDQIEDILCNPNDAKEPWYYKRRLLTPSNPQEIPSDSPYQGEPYILLPDVDYNPQGYERPKEYNKIPIKWDARVLHVKTGALSTMKFGIPELFPALAWATAYKKILENFATILQAYARIAMVISGLAGKKGTAAAKSKLNTTIKGEVDVLDKNPPPNTAAWAALSGAAEIKPVKTANSTTGPDEARALRSMVAAGSDTPEHFFGDSDIGNFATSTTLDRPTELKMVARQKMWADVIQHICRKLVEWSSQAPKGKLREAGFKFAFINDPFDGTQMFQVTPPTKAVSMTVSITFPPIVEREVVDRVRAVVQAATLGGSKAEGIIPDRKVLFKMLMVALGQKNVEELADELYPQSVIQGYEDPAEEVELKRDVAKAKIKQLNKPKPDPAPPAEGVAAD